MTRLWQAPSDGIKERVPVFLSRKRTITNDGKPGTKPQFNETRPICDTRQPRPREGHFAVNGSAPQRLIAQLKFTVNDVYTAIHLANDSPMVSSDVRVVETASEHSEQNPT